jgi:DHA1 family multidrug resistance protein-like MFS transporter
MRSVFGGSFPLIATAMYKNLGVDWASTLLALLGCAFIPIPFLLRRYGKKLRGASPHAEHEM